MANTAISNTIIQGAPSSALYVTLATHPELSSERVLTAGTGITLTDGGAGGTLTIAADSPTTAATQSDQETAASTSTFVSPGRQHFHPSAAKSWCFFNSSATIGTSYNVASVTDVGTGNWTVNIATDMSSSNYAVAVTGGFRSFVSPLVFWPSVLTAGTCTISAATSMTSTSADPDTPDQIHFQSFGDQ